MYIYFELLLLLIVFSIKEVLTGKCSKATFNFLFLILAILLCFKYGQGTDYFGYKLIYLRIGDVLSKGGNIFDVLKNGEIHGEYGFKIVFTIFANFGIPYEAISIMLSFILSFFLYIFIINKCRYKVLALLLGYHTLYLTYMSSAIRQALVLLLFLTFMLDELLEGKHVKYCVLVVLAASFHSSAYLYGVLPILLSLSKKIGFKDNIYIYIYISVKIIVSFLIGLILAGKWVNNVVGFVLPQNIMHYFGNMNKVRIASILERLLLFFICVFLVEKNKSFMFKNSRELLLFDFFGLILYLLFYKSALIASRINILFKIVEILIISNADHSLISKKPILTFICLYCMAMYAKNVNSYIKEVPYVNNINVVNYPYISIFDKDNIDTYVEINNYKYYMQTELNENLW